MGTKSGPNAHDTHLDVTIHHDTESFVALGGSFNKNALTSQLGQDSFIYKMDYATGKPSSVYAMDTVPIDGNLYGNGTNGRWGGWSYIEALDSFDLAGEPDRIAAIGMVRGRLTFPGTPDKQLTNNKNSCYDPWVAKIDVATSKVVWATKEKIDIPAPTDPEESCDSAYPASVVTTAAGHVITSTDSRINRKYSNQPTKFNGATGAFVWQKDFGQALYGERNAKMSSAGGEKVIYTGTFEGNASAGAAFFAPQTSTSSCEDGEKESAAIASFDVSATDAPVADWVVTMCGDAAATVVQGDCVYAVGQLSASTTLAHAPSSTTANCTMTGELGGYLVKLQKSDGKCVWAKDVPEFRRVVADANSVWGMTSDDEPVKFDANNTVTPRGRDLIMGKFSASLGHGHWGAAMGGASTDYAYDMTMTPHGPLAVGYSTSESTTVGDVTVNNLQKDVENGQAALFVIQLLSTDKIPSCIDQCPSGSLIDATIKAGNCYADAVCLANGDFSPSRPCFRCDSGTEQTLLTGPITENHCFIDGKCITEGTHEEVCINSGRSCSPDPCSKCVPSVNTTAYSPVIEGCMIPLSPPPSPSPVGGCYGAGACTAPNGCADCSMTEAECTSAGKTWVADATSLCAAGTPAIMGCRYYSPGSGYHCDCTMGNDYENLCAVIRWSWWTECSTEASHTGCDAPPSAELIAARLAAAPPSPPLPPPLPPSTPPAPPQRCIPQVRYRTNSLPSRSDTHMLSPPPPLAGPGQRIAPQADQSGRPCQ